MTAIRTVLCALAAAAGCDRLAPSSQLPWLGGTHVLAVSDTPTQAAARDAIALGAADEAAYGALEIRGGLSDDSEPQTIIASYGFGVVVLDSSGHALARTKPFARAGAADSVVALALVDGPTLAVAVQAGGHRESVITLRLYRMDEHGLQTLVALPVEEHEGEVTRVGGILLVPGGLIYRAPGAAAATTWRYDPRRMRYLELPANNLRYFAK